MLCSTPQSQNDASAPFFHAGSGTSPAGAGGAPASPTHPKHYDQLLNELRHAQVNKQEPIVWIFKFKFTLIS